MSFWAYMLHCRGGVYYVGHTDNLELRISQHQCGAIAGFTADHLPVTLVWSQDFPTRHEAKEAERRLKGWSRAKKMALIRGDWDRISTLAKGKNGPSTSSGQTGEGEGVALSATVAQQTDLSPHPARPELVEGLSLSLVCHPSSPPKLVRAVYIAICGTEPRRLECRVEGAESLHLPSLVQRSRADELWRTTCFELFVKSANTDSYTEYNFSPSSAWAAYAFDGYRANMRNAPMHEPRILDWYDYSTYELYVETGPTFPAGPLEIALAAVIEETDGTKSYWALAHPPGQPDFHHPDCFALTLPAPSAV